MQIGSATLVINHEWQICNGSKYSSTRVAISASGSMLWKVKSVVFLTCNSRLVDLIAI